MSRSPRNEESLAAGAVEPQEQDAASSDAGGEETAPQLISSRLLRAWPLPQPGKEGDKEERGRVLIVGGSPEMPGTLILAATAALRAGAGKLRIAAARRVAPLAAQAVPEARVFSFAATRTGAPTLGSAAEVAARAEEVDAVLFGPGMTDEEAVTAWLRDLLPRLAAPTVVLDAAALACLAQMPDLLRSLDGKAVVTPHAGEAAMLLGRKKEAVARDPLATARYAARLLNACFVLKGAETVIAAPDGRRFVNRAGNVGLATSGSGDALAGIIAGLAARGAEPLQAAVWGVRLHAGAGDNLARRRGRLGYLARELADEVPALMAAFGSESRHWA